MRLKGTGTATAALLLSFALFASALPARAAAPDVKFPVTFTTTLTPGILYPFTFSIWDAKIGGTQVAGWAEGPVKLPVASNKTVYFVLGSKVPLPALDFTQQYWVEIATEFKKYRTRLPAAGYAFWSEAVNTDPLDARYVEEGQEGAVTDAMIGRGQVTAAKVGSESAASGEVLAADGAGGAAWQTLSGLPPAAHQHAGEDVTSGTVGAARIDAAIARDAEIVPAVLAADGAGSGLDADLLDGQHAVAFAPAGHSHDASGHTHDASYWKLGGNGGTAAGTNFIGTTDNQALEIKVNGVRAMRFVPGATPNIVGGDTVNAVTDGVVGAVIGGGGAAQWEGQSYHENYVSDAFGTVSGGAANRAGDSSGTTTDAGFATVGGGRWNNAEGATSTISGGRQNLTQQMSSTVGGGAYNAAVATVATVSGGDSNTAAGVGATVIGGIANYAKGNYSVVLGGWENYAGGRGSLAAGYSSRVRGPQPDLPEGDIGTFIWSDVRDDLGLFTSTGSNQFLIRATGGVGINKNNPATALDVSGTVTASNANVTGTVNAGTATVNSLAFDIAFGQKITLNPFWKFGIGVQNGVLYSRTDPDNMYGGFAWYSGGTHNDGLFNAGGGRTLMTLDQNGNLTTAGVLSQLSDRNLKEDFAPVDAREVLAKVAALPISTWQYKADTEGARHLGPVAQDFRAAFGLGVNDTTIGTVDADGVALAAIQGLNAVLAEQRVALEAQRAEIAELRSQVAAQALLVERLLAASGRGVEQTAILPASPAH